MISKSSRAQFMVVTIVLIGISFFAMFLLVRTIDRSSVVMFEERQASFENLQNSIEQRNIWIGSYWGNLSWENRTVVNITGGIANPVIINPGIPSGTDCKKEVRVISSSGTEIDSNVSTENSPCDVIFSAAVGAYSIYWNNPSAIAPAYRSTVSDTGTSPTYSTIRTEASPKYKLCRHLQDISMASGEKLDCAVQNIYSNTKINYTIEYKSFDFSFRGFLSGGETQYFMIPIPPFP